MREIWKPILGFENLYVVSNLGKVKRLSTDSKKGSGNYARSEHLISQRENNNGYRMVDLYKENQRSQFLVHRLVAAAFIPNPDNKEEVGHKDETRTNNYADNLEWVSKKENNNMPLHKERVRIACLNRREQISHYMSESQKGSSNSAARKVICDNKIYGCILECADYYGIGYSRMKAWLRGQNAMPQEWIDKGLKYIE